MGRGMNEQEVEDMISQWATDYPHYYTDGTHFIASPSYRKGKRLLYLGRCHNAREARRVFEDWLQAQSKV